MSLQAFAAPDYGSLGWVYPLDGSYTSYYRGYSSGHKGFDFDAPKDAEIRSVDSGDVKFSGYHSSTGYYVVVANDTKVPGISNPLYVRYLHMDYSPEVVTNDPVRAEMVIGFVGSDGDYIGNSPVPHLHMDINTIKATGGSKFTTSNTIDPALFFPDVDFELTRSRSASFADAPEAPFNPNDHIDTNLIRHVGTENFNNWVKGTDAAINIATFKAHFNISDQQFQSMITSYGISNLYA